MKYSVILRKSAIKDLSSLPKKVQTEIADALESLAKNPRRALGVKDLKGKLKGVWRLRVGEYRVAYTIKDLELIVLVIRIGNRKEIYRMLSGLKVKSFL